jgi:hypothetical protein
VSVPETAAREAILRALPAPPAWPFEDWGDVLTRADVARARRTTRRALVVAIALLAVAVLAVPAVGVGSRVADLFWEDGEPVDPSFEESVGRLFEVMPPASEPELIATDGSRAFYLYRHMTGRVCIAAGSVSGKVRIGWASCPAADARDILPTPEDPIFKRVAFHGRLGPPRESNVWRVEGLVDYAESVALVDANGKILLSASVTDHVFMLQPDLPIPEESVEAVVAYDGDGDEIYREGLDGD